MQRGSERSGSAAGTYISGYVSAGHIFSGEAHGHNIPGSERTMSISAILDQEIGMALEDRTRWRHSMKLSETDTGTIILRSRRSQ